MSNSFRTIYLYVVSFITLSMIVGGIVSSVNSITTYMYPTSSIFYEESSDTQSNYYKYDDYTSTNNTEIKKENYKREKIKDTIVSIAIIIVGAIMYRYHWKLIEQERQKKE